MPRWRAFSASSSFSCQRAAGLVLGSQPSTLNPPGSLEGFLKERERDRDRDRERERERERWRGRERERTSRSESPAALAPRVSWWTSQVHPLRCP